MSRQRAPRAAIPIAEPALGGDVKRRWIVFNPTVASSAQSDETMSNPRPTPPTPDEESSIEEARLRQQAIGVKLRQMFDDIVNEPVPDDFLDILRKADAPKSSGG